MNKERYFKFKQKYLDRFIKYYREANAAQKKEVKRSIFDNPNITIDEKEKFWEEVMKGAKNGKSKTTKRK